MNSDPIRELDGLHILAAEQGFDVLERARMASQDHFNRIAVSAGDDAVTLTGEVGSYLEKWEAERVAKQVYGVAGVATRTPRCPAVDRTPDQRKESRLVRRVAAER